MKLDRTLWAERLSPPNLRRIGLALSIGAVGGASADAVGVPLAWMLGSLFACMAASMAGLPVSGPNWLRSTFIGVIGLFLGESFNQTPVEQFAEWPFSMVLAMLYAPVGGFAAYLFYRKVAHMARIDALLSGAPGGLSAIVAIATELRADEKRVVLSQSLRVAIVIVSAPFIAFNLLALPVPTEATFATADIISISDAAILIAAAIASVLLLAKVGLPMGFLIGPMLVSAVLRVTGVVDGEMPHWMLELSLLVAGSSIGCRFLGADLKDLARIAVLTVVGTAILMAVAFVFALLATYALDINFFAALLAYAPGGIAEMSLIAIAIDADPGFVATHHLVRITFILIFAPVFGAWVRRKFSED